MAKRPIRVKRVRKIAPATNRTVNVTRAEFNAVIALLNERGEIINDIRRELQTQFARIAQLQQEIDALKRRG